MIENKSEESECILSLCQKSSVHIDGKKQQIGSVTTVNRSKIYLSQVIFLSFCQQEFSQYS